MSVTAVIGYGGGSGRTSLAVALARLNVQVRAKETLVVSVKKCSDIWDYFPHNSKDKSDINLMLLDHISGRLDSLSGLTIADSCGIHTFIPPANGLNDIISLSYEEMNSLIDMIEAERQFDSLIFDIGCDVPPKAVLDRADRILMINDTRRGISNSEKIWRSKISDKNTTDKITLIDNFARPVSRDIIFLDDDSQNYEYDNLNYNNSDYSLPYDEDSFFVKNGLKDISMVGAYSKALSEFVKSEMPL